MNKIIRESQSEPSKTKECLLRRILTKDLDISRHDLGGCNSAEECLLPKQDVVGSNPITRSIKLGDNLLKWQIYYSANRNKR